MFCRRFAVPKGLLNEYSDERFHIITASTLTRVMPYLNILFRKGNKYQTSAVICCSQSIGHAHRSFPLFYQRQMTVVTGKGIQINAIKHAIGATCNQALVYFWMPVNAFVTQKLCTRRQYFERMKLKLLAASCNIVYYV